MRFDVGFGINIIHRSYFKITSQIIVLFEQNILRIFRLIVEGKSVTARRRFIFFQDLNKIIGEKANGYLTLF